MRAIIQDEKYGFTVLKKNFWVLKYIINLQTNKKVLLFYA